MKSSRKNDKKKDHRITEVGITSDTLTSRGGLSLFVRYLFEINIFPELVRRLGRLRKNANGIQLIELLKQFFCFLADGTSRHLTYFDELKKDEGYARGIETDPADMASSHAIKRFFKSFSWPLIWSFRKILKQMWIWRLNIVQPDLVIIDIDSMVMDNDEAEKRHGVSPTYKKVKGFHPIQATWGRFIVDAVFQGGKNHCNHGDTVFNLIKHLVADIRLHYRPDVAILFTLDSGYFDQKLLELCETLQVGFVCGGKLYRDIKAHLQSLNGDCFQTFTKGAQTWDFLEFGSKPGSWTKFRRAIFCRPVYENRQALLEFARHDSLIYTNLGMGGPIDRQVRELGRQDLFTAEGCITLYHGRGRNELVHRSFKDFGFQELPFKRFAPNAAVYYFMVLAFFLFESFKEDVLAGVIPVSSQPGTVRRKIIDIASKIVRSGGRVILKVSAAAWEALNFAQLWEKCSNPPKLSWDEGY